MNNEIKIFENDEFGRIRTSVIDGEPWFVAADICKVFGDSNHNRTARRVDEVDKTTTEIVDNMGRRQSAVVVNESGLYAMLFSMQPQKANNHGVSDAYPIEVGDRIDKLRRFKRWVTHDILPTIRKTGGYVANDDKFIDTYLPFADDTTKLLFRNTLETVRKQNELIAEMKPKALFADTACKSKDNILVRTMAKILSDNGFAIGQNKLYQLLRDKKILMRNNEPYQRYVDLKYFVYEEVPVETPYGIKLEHTTRITPNGQIWITSKINEWKEELYD